MNKYIALLTGLILTGCSYTKPIGKVGSGTNQLKFYKVQLGSLSAPAQTLLVMEDASGKLSAYEPQAGNGVVPAVPQAAAVAYLGHAIGGGLADADGDKTTVTQRAAPTATAGASAASSSSSSALNNSRDFIGPRLPPGWQRKQ